jgi:hypothetical protein
MLGAGFVASCALLLASCVLPRGRPTELSSAAFPDPAAVNKQQGNRATVVGTSDMINGVAFDIPAFNWTIGTKRTSLLFDAMPPGDQWYTDALNGQWAPSVSYIGRKYVMWLSSRQQSGRPNCLNAAVSLGGSSEGPYKAVYQACAGNAGAFDPSIFKARDGSLWLAWSTDHYGAQGEVTDSYISAARLKPDGLSFFPNEPAMSIVTFSSLTGVSCVYMTHRCTINGDEYSNGPHAVVENPQLVVAPRRTTYDGVTFYIDVFVSYGTWNSADSYHTLEFACEDFFAGMTDPGCAPTLGLDVSNVVLGRDAALSNPGGLSLMDLGSRSSLTPRYALFAASGKALFGPRRLYWMSSGFVYRLAGAFRANCRRHRRGC